MNQAQRIVVAVAAPVSLYALVGVLWGEWGSVGDGEQASAQWLALFLATGLFEAWLWRDPTRPFLLGARTWKRLAVGATSVIALGVGAAVVVEHADRQQRAEAARAYAEAREERAVQYLQEYKGLSMVQLEAEAERLAKAIEAARFRNDFKALRAEGEMSERLDALRRVQRKQRSR